MPDRRIRTELTIDAKTGRQKRSTTLLPDESSIDKRWGDLREFCEAKMPDAEAEILFVVCDGCNSRQRVAEPKLPAGWTTNERGEFCPACSAEG